IDLTQGASDNAANAASQGAATEMASSMSQNTTHTELMSLRQEVDRLHDERAEALFSAAYDRGLETGGFAPSMRKLVSSIFHTMRKQERREDKPTSFSCKLADGNNRTFTASEALLYLIEHGVTAPTGEAVG